MGSDRREGGQVILLAGILLSIAYILFSTQFALIATIGQQAGRESRNPVLEDYLIIRESLQSTLSNELLVGDDVVCPDDEADFGDRVSSLLLMLTSHEQNRGLSFFGSVGNVTPGAGNITVEIFIFLTDGVTTLDDSLTYRIECVSD